MNRPMVILDDHASARRIAREDEDARPERGHSAGVGAIIVLIDRQVAPPFLSASVSLSMARRKMSSSESRRLVHAADLNALVGGHAIEIAGFDVVGHDELDAAAGEAGAFAAEFAQLRRRRLSVAPTVSSSMKLRCERRSSSMLQSAAMRPFLRIRTSSQVSSISRSRWEEMSRRMLPSLRISWMRLDHALAGDGIEAVGGLVEDEQAGGRAPGPGPA